MSNMPGVRPAVPHFSSGPCAKRPGWSLQALTDAALGRSHRSKSGKAKLQRSLDLTREVLEIPADYRVGLTPASDTGAVEAALWSMLGRARSRCSPGRASAKAGSRTSPRNLSSRTSRCSRPRTAKFRSRQGEPRSRRGVHVEWHHHGRAGAQRRLDRRRPQGARDLRRHLGGVRAAARLQEARCRHLLLAEGAGRGSRARHPDPAVPARRSNGSRRSYAEIGRCRRSSASPRAAS